MAEISNVAGGLRLLQALAAAEDAESMHGPAAKVDLDVLWIFIGKVSPQRRLQKLSMCVSVCCTNRNQSELSTGWAPEFRS